MDRGATRVRMIETALSLFQRDGYRATSWRRLTAAGGTPWGSVHHHFPGGKEQLGQAAIAKGAELVDLLLESCLTDASRPDESVRRLFRESATVLAAGNFTGGCPLAAIALETASSSEPLRQACATAFGTWERRLAAFFGDAGLGRDDARTLATAVLASYEGALLLARVRRTTEPLEAAGATVARWLNGIGRAPP